MTITRSEEHLLKLVTERPGGTARAYMKLLVGVKNTPMHRLFQTVALTRIALGRLEKAGSVALINGCWWPQPDPAIVDTETKIQRALYDMGLPATTAQARKVVELFV